jgi:hypothetical protein
MAVRRYLTTANFMSKELNAKVPSGYRRSGGLQHVFIEYMLLIVDSFYQVLTQLSHVNQHLVF